MELEAAKMIGAGLAAIALAGAGVGIGIIFGNYLSGAMRNPSAAQKQFPNLLLGFALAEATGLFGLVVALLAVQNDLFAAETGMPQLDPKYWASQAFWLILVFTILYISIEKFYLPKIRNNLDNRENKIKDDLEDANKFKELSESRFKEYEKILDDAKKEVVKIHLESKNSLDKDMQTRKLPVEKEIEKEITKAQEEINDLKKNSVSDIQKISENIASNIIEKISGDKLNESSIKATVEDISKKNLSKYL